MVPGNSCRPLSRAATPSHTQGKTQYSAKRACDGPEYCSPVRAHIVQRESRKADNRPKLVNRSGAALEYIINQINDIGGSIRPGTVDIDRCFTRYQKRATVAALRTNRMNTTTLYAFHSIALQAAQYLRARFLTGSVMPSQAEQARAWVLSTDRHSGMA